MRITKKTKKNKTRINLLPYEDRIKILNAKKRLIILIIIAAYIILLAVSDIGFYMASVSKGNIIAKLNERLLVLRSKNILYKNMNNVILKKEKLQGILKKEISAIEKLGAMKTNWSGKLIKIVGASPNGVWLNGISAGKGTLNINGNSLSLINISEYIKNLKATGFLKKLYLKSVGRKSVKGNTYYSFVIEGVLTMRT